MEDYLSQLNPSQRDSVAYCEGPQLVIAGAGSGKTRVLVERLLSPATPAAVSGSKGSGIGFRNVHQRIQLTFGREYGLTILSEPDDGTVVRIRLPALDEEAGRRYRKEGEQ